MPSEITRCTECGVALKAVPAWLAGTKVNFTCTACPRRSKGLAAARFEPAVEPRAVGFAEPEADVEAVPGLEELDEVADLEVPLDDLEEPKEPE